MFSGIVEKQGTLIRRVGEGKQLVLTVRTSEWAKPLKRGESIAVNGVCLTVARLPNKRQFVVQAVPETVAQTAIGDLKPKDIVNLERSLKWGERLGGHFVLGHVDGVGRVVKKEMHGKSYSLTIEVPARVRQLLIPKGSIAVDGVSLTIQKLGNTFVTVAIVPHTAKTTSLARKRSFSRVNLEADVIAKHLARWIQTEHSKSLSADESA